MWSARLKAGISPRDADETAIQMALDEINRFCLDVINKGPCLWLEEKQLLQLVDSQISYVLPNYTFKVSNVVATNPVRLNTGGVAASSAGGNAAACFDPLQTTGCTQILPNGNISYTYVPPALPAFIMYVGISSLTETTYELVVEYSLDGVHWIVAQAAPPTLYVPGQLLWMVCEYAATAKAWRIREVGNATLAIQQIYFSQPDTQANSADRPIAPFSQSDYMNVPNKLAQGQTNTYYFNQKNPPVLWVWLAPAPNQGSYTNLLYSQTRFCRTVAQLSDEVDLPPYFLNALTDDLAARFANLYNSAKWQQLSMIAAQSLQAALLKNYQNVPLKFSMGGGVA